jgi:hypothetical protein
MQRTAARNITTVHAIIFIKNTIDTWEIFTYAQLPVRFISAELTIVVQFHRVLRVQGNLQRFFGILFVVCLYFLCVIVKYTDFSREFIFTHVIYNADTTTSISLWTLFASLYRVQWRVHPFTEIELYRVTGRFSFVEEAISQSKIS